MYTSSKKTVYSAGNLTIYPKNVRDSIPAHVIKAIRQEIEDAQE